MAALIEKKEHAQTFHKRFLDAICENDAEEIKKCLSALSADLAPQELSDAISEGFIVISAACNAYSQNTQRDNCQLSGPHGIHITCKLTPHLWKTGLAVFNAAIRHVPYGIVSYAQAGHSLAIFQSNHFAEEEREHMENPLECALQHLLHTHPPLHDGNISFQNMQYLIEEMVSIGWGDTYGEEIETNANTADISTLLSKLEKKFPHFTEEVFTPAYQKGWLRYKEKILPLLEEKIPPKELISILTDYMFLGNPKKPQANKAHDASCAATFKI